MHSSKVMELSTCVHAAAEMIAVDEMWRGAAKERGVPIIVFNGELDRIR
jgi:hypothetical protein